MVWSNLQWKAIILVKVLGSGRISWAREILGMGRSRRYVEHVKLRRLSGREEIQGEREGQSEKKESRFGRRIVVKTISLSSLLGPD
jgi:hypothetical protein